MFLTNLQEEKEEISQTHNPDLLRLLNLDNIDIWHVPDHRFRLERFECFFNPFAACDSQIAIDAIFNGIGFQPRLIDHTATLLMQKGIVGVGKYDAFHWRRGDFKKNVLGRKNSDQLDPDTKSFFWNGTWCADQVLARVHKNAESILPLVLLTPSDHDQGAVLAFKRAYPAPVVQISEIGRAHV